jgi:hypothetical protein
MKRGTSDHPKLKLLCDILNIEKFEAVGILEMLWHFTAKFAPQGDIGKYSDKAIAEAVGWKRPTGTKGVTPECKLSGALVTAGWLDSDAAVRLVVHDWSDHADQSVKKFLASRNLAFIKRHDSLPVPEARSQKPQPATSGRAAEFAAAFPNQSDRNSTVREYISLVDPSEEDLVFACLARYKASDGVARGVLQAGWRWLRAQKENGWRGEWPRDHPRVRSPTEEKYVYAPPEGGYYTGPKKRVSEENADDAKPPV